MVGGTKWCTGNVKWAREIYSVLNSNVENGGTQFRRVPG